MCFGGDTYLGVLDYAHTLLFTRNDPDDRNGFKRFVAAYIPLESSVNLHYRNDEHFSQDTTVSTGNAQTGEANIYFFNRAWSIKYKLHSRKAYVYI